MPKVKVTIRSEVKLCLNLYCSYTTKANGIKLHRKIKHNEKMCHAHDFGSYAQGQGRIWVVSQQYSKTAEANLTKLHRKIEHNKKVCCAQE